jgi:hypothetical protein
LWIDADGSIMRRPEFLRDECPYDFAARKMDPKPNMNRVWHVGTLYFNYTEPALNLLREWVAHANVTKSSDEQALDNAWKKNADLVDGIKTGELPKEYFEFLRQPHFKPEIKTIICHRGSRDSDKMAMKQRVNGKLHKARS